jgi:hypothetical protein
MHLAIVTLTRPGLATAQRLASSLDDRVGIYTTPALAAAPAIKPLSGHLGPALALYRQRRHADRG